jgi:hypothetical protein
MIASVELFSPTISSMTTADLRRRLAELDAAIARQKVALNELERDRTAVHRQLNATSTFPVLALPVEITAEIFSLCPPSIEELREYAVDCDADWFVSLAPTLFLGVCRIWREIARETPALWTTLYVRLDTVEYAVASGGIERLIDRWLERAALRPLSIALCARLRERESEPNTALPSRMRNVIRRYASRIQYLELDHSQQDMRQLGLDSVTFLLLRRAVLEDVWAYGPGLDTSKPVALFNNAPRLGDLRLSSGTFFCYYTLPSLQMTKFEGSSTPWSYLPWPQTSWKRGVS